MSERKSKPWKDFTLEEKVIFWATGGFPDEQIAYYLCCDDINITKEKVREICEKEGVKVLTIEQSVSYLWSMRGLTDAELAYEIRTSDSFNSKESIQRMREIREKLGLKENPKRLSSSAYWGRVEADPSH